MPIQDELCSKCHKNGMECSCENFHPPLPMTLDSSYKSNSPTCHACGDEIKIKESVTIYHRDCDDNWQDNFIEIRKEEAFELQEYFYKDAGYFSHEVYPLVHELVKRLDRFLK